MYTFHRSGICIHQIDLKKVKGDEVLPSSLTNIIHPHQDLDIHVG